MLHPNEYVFTSANDGLKTYYNFAWHGYHDTSFLELNGMNYPYGEFILFEDSLPLFSTVKKLLSFCYPKIADLVVGAGEGSGSQVTVYRGSTLTNDNPPIDNSFDAFAGFGGGMYVG
jgi:hypothetical protein